jgi:hypothetical protein
MLAASFSSPRYRARYGHRAMIVDAPRLVSPDAWFTITFDAWRYRCHLVSFCPVAHAPCPDNTLFLFTTTPEPGLPYACHGCLASPRPRPVGRRAMIAWLESYRRAMEPVICPVSRYRYAIYRYDLSHTEPPPYLNDAQRLPLPVWFCTIELLIILPMPVLSYHGGGWRVLVIRAFIPEQHTSMSIIMLFIHVYAGVHLRIMSWVHLCLYDVYYLSAMSYYVLCLMLGYWVMRRCMSTE